MLGSNKPKKEVFPRTDLEKLNELFLNDFEGVTFEIKTPSRAGRWPQGRTKKTIVNEHDIIVIEQNEVTFATRPSFNEKFLKLMLRRQRQKEKGRYKYLK